MSLRFFADPGPERGELVMSRDEGGSRHFLDGKPVHCGTLLVHVAPDWVCANVDDKEALVRYESKGPISPSSARMFFEGGSRAIGLNDRFRWPTRHELEHGLKRGGS